MTEKLELNAYSKSLRTLSAFSSIYQLLRLQIATKYFVVPMLLLSVFSFFFFVLLLLW